MDGNRINTYMHPILYDGGLILFDLYGLKKIETNNQTQNIKKNRDKMKIKD